VPYVNRTDDWFSAQPTLEQALETARGAAARDKLHENIETLRRNITFGACWFCKSRASHEDHAAPLLMYGNVRREPHGWDYSSYTLRWQTMTLKVPRCSTCARAHRPWDLRTLLGGLLGGLVGFGGYALVDWLTGQWFYGLLLISVLMVVGGWVGGILNRRRFGKGIRSLGHGKKHPEVKKLLSEGWSFGSRPAGA
jgi:hypothetical protein